MDYRRPAGGVIMKDPVDKLSQAYALKGVLCTVLSQCKAVPSVSGLYYHHEIKDLSTYAIIERWISIAPACLPPLQSSLGHEYASIWYHDSRSTQLAI